MGIKDTFDNLFYRIYTILLAVTVGVCVYFYILEPHVTNRLCLTDSNACIKIEYYSYGNTALVKMENTGSWVWFNGEKAYIYGQPVGQLCEDPTRYEGAYTVNVKNGLKEGYKCVITLQTVIDYYRSRKVTVKYLMFRPPNPTRREFSIYDLLNYLDSKGVITLPT